MQEVSTKPYLIRAIYDWCNDAGFTPYIAVAVDASVRVPPEFVKNGEIVLNISALATNRLKIGNDAIEFQARFSGVPREVYVPVPRVLAVYARENGQGMAFEVARGEQPAGQEEGAVAAAATAGEEARDRGVLVPIAPVEPRADSTPEPTPPTPRPGERPKLTRVK